MENIRSFAFAWCNGLTEVTFPNSVTNIRQIAFFRGCDGLKSINVAEGNPCYRSVDGLVLTKDGKTLVAVPDGLEHVTIPVGVTDIGERAFANHANLIGVEITDGVTNIGEYAFDSCTNMTEIVIPNGVRSIGNGAFRGCSNLKSVAVPKRFKKKKSLAVIFTGCPKTMKITYR